MKIMEERKVVRLKKPFLACVTLLGAAMGLQATPVCPSTTAGTPVYYSELQSLGSCTIGDKTFSDFTYSGSATGATPVPSSDVTVTTIDNGTSAIGFLFGVSLNASAGQTNDIGIGYTVTGPDITDAAVTMAGLAAGPGAADSIAETICPGSSIAGCTSSLPLSTYNIVGGPSKTTDTVSFAPVGTLGVLKDVAVVGGGGLASISLFTDTVSQTAIPEPGFYGVLAGGVGAVLMFARRRKKSA
jgi:hypothetical protein